MLEYLGPLPVHDPLHAYLQTEILPQLGYSWAPVEFAVFRLGERHSVYLYDERHSGLRVVCKFFAGPFQHGTSSTDRHMNREYENLQFLRGCGFCGYPHEVVRPLGRNSDLSSLLVEEYVDGCRLSRYFEAAVTEGALDPLFARLTALAYFMASMHNRTATGEQVDFGQDCAYLDRLVRQLGERGRLSEQDANEIYWLRDRWAEQPRMWEDRQVVVHGDATPANFLLGDGLQVTAVDLERMKRADRVFDVGRIAGEIQHAFLLARGNKYAAEPFIGHFLWEYCCHFPDRERAFVFITGRVPFHMAVTLLRIARNEWVSPEYSRILVREALTSLRTY